MNELVMNPNNKKYYSKEYIKGWENGVKAQYEARLKGEWIETNEGTVCSNCGQYPYDDGEYHVANWKSDFCPNCGADTRGGTE